MLYACNTYPLHVNVLAANDDNYASSRIAPQPLHTTYAMLHEEIVRYEARCTEYTLLHAHVHNAAISKVTLGRLAWPYPNQSE